MFLSHEKHEGMVVKMTWDGSDLLHPRESYTDQYTHWLGSQKTEELHCENADTITAEKGAENAISKPFR